MAGTLRWPVVNPGNSWSVPRIAMPDFFAVQWDFKLESWFYGGHAIDEDGNLYSLNVYFARAALDLADPANPVKQGVMLGTGIGVAAADSYHVSIGQGIGVSQDPALPIGLVVPPVMDQAYAVAFVPEVAGGPKGSARFVPATEPVGPAVGMAGAHYRLDFAGTDAGGAAMTLGLDLVDELGARMEGCSAYVGPPIDPTGLYTYEVAQPRLRIAGGTLSAGGRTVTLAGGSLWHDRQVYNQEPSAPAAAATKGLYCGTWIPLMFDNGLTANISANWQPIPGCGTQWIAGRKVGAPPIGGTGNLYLPDDPDLLNGGAMLRAIREHSDHPWDFDINIFDPDDPAASPSWSAGAGSPTYCTKWWVTFSDRLVAHWGVPRDIYVVALVQGCEFAPPGETPFWEGATEIFADRACTERIGRGWAEQMGYN
jgi:hypothetical protein